MNHTHSLVQVTKKNDADFCYGKYLFGECKSNEREIKTFYNIKCSDINYVVKKYFGLKIICCVNYV